jgi:hypothetical protein
MSETTETGCTCDPCASCRQRFSACCEECSFCVDLRARRDREVFLTQLRKAIRASEHAHHEEGWYGGQPISLTEYESVQFKAHWQEVKARKASAYEEVNRLLTVLTHMFDES